MTKMKLMQGWANIFYGESHGKVFSTWGRIYYIYHRF